MHEQLVTVDRQKEEVSPPSSPTTPTPGILKKPQASPRSRDQGGVNKSCKLHTSQKKTQTHWMLGHQLTWDYF